MPAHDHLDAEIASALTQIASAGARVSDPTTTDIESARQQMAAYYKFVNKPVEGVGTFSDRIVDSGDVVARCRVHWPRWHLSRASAIVYVHGGGWTFGAVDSHERIMQLIARRSGLPVVGLDYDLAPQVRWPTQQNQLSALVDEILGGRFQSLESVDQLILVGDSAGANLLAEQLKRLGSSGRQSSVRAAMLFYGVFLQTVDSCSWLELGDGRYGLSRAKMVWYWAQYRGNLQTSPESMGPTLEEFSHWPRTRLVVGSLDPLLDDSRYVHAALRAAGVENELEILPGYVHGFLSFSSLSKKIEAQITAWADWLVADFDRESGK